MKHDSNRVRRLNQQIEVWRKHAPEYNQVLENKLATQSAPNVGKQGQLILSARNMTEEEYDEQENIMYYIEHELGTWTDQYKAVESRLAQQYEVDPSEISDSQIEKFVNLKGRYNDLIKDMFDIYDSDQARFNLNISEAMTEKTDQIEYLTSIMDDDPDELPFDLAEYKKQQEKGNPYIVNNSKKGK